MNYNDPAQSWQKGAQAGGGSMAFTYPAIIERISHDKRIAAIDVRSKLMEERIIFLGEPVYPQNANIIVCQLLHLNSQNKKTDIQLFINSPGGDVQAGLAIYDAMRYVECDISTICIGLAASMGAFLLAAGAKGKRFALPNARIMIHQPWTSGVGGQVSDVMIEAAELQKTKDQLNKILAGHCGKDIKEVEAATDRNKWMSSSEAKDYGLIDGLAGTRENEAQPPAPAS